MGAALTPGLALEYLHELSAHVRAGVVLDASGARLAGPASLEAPGAAALAALGDAVEGEALLADGAVFAVRSARVALVLVCGPRALPELTRHDLRAVLADLERGGAGSPPPSRSPLRPEREVSPAFLPGELPRDVAGALLSAAQCGPPGG